jgi:glycerol-3-phosphate dehydrogenase
MNLEFSYKTRQKAIDRFRSEVFDLLIIGGGITGASVARDAQSRGLKVALIEKGDFGSGTSSASSKLIHGGVRYLENFEFKLVFEALSERTHLLKTSPNMVRPLPFYIPVYETDPRGKNILSLGLWLYDLLALFRAPGFHKRFSKNQMLKEMPSLKPEGLTGGFMYYDASMWDDVMVVENARAAYSLGAAVASYVEGVSPIWAEVQGRKKIAGFSARDVKHPQSNFEIRAKRTVICAGPWTDLVGESLNQDSETGSSQSAWRPWLKPSSGIHLVFDSKRFPVKGALLLAHPTDGRIFFVIPRPDFGAGVTLVGTTDGPSPKNPEDVKTEKNDVDYLLGLLQVYFPELKLKSEDVISTYVGVRPLVDPEHLAQAEGKSQSSGGVSLQKVSREHHIEKGPGGSIIVAGGKYTTHRTMAQDIVDFTLKAWEEDRWLELAPTPPPYLTSKTKGLLNPAVHPVALKWIKKKKLPKEWIERFGADASIVESLSHQYPETQPSPEGFPGLAAQFRYVLSREMVMGLDDFYLRRLPLYLARADHSIPWLEELSHVWQDFFQKSEEERQAEVARFNLVLAKKKQGYHI